MQNKSTKILLLIIAVLLIANLAWVVFFVKSCRAPKPHDKQHFKKVVVIKLKENVGFTEEQIKKYHEFETAHESNVELLVDKLKKYKTNFFTITNGSTNPQVYDSVLNDIMVTQKEVYIKTLEHINRVRTICTQPQIPKYDSLVKKYAESKNHK